MVKRCFASVLMAHISAPWIPSSTQRLIVFDPPPPHPMMRMLTFSVSASFASSSSSALAYGFAGAGFFSSTNAWFSWCFAIASWMMDFIVCFPAPFVRRASYALP